VNGEPRVEVRDGEVMVVFPKSRSCGWSEVNFEHVHRFEDLYQRAIGLGWRRKIEARLKELRS